MDVSSQNQLIEQLKEDVEGLLKKVGQKPSVPVQEALIIIMEALIGDQFIRHSNPDVRVTIASCLNEVMRITAPFQPYEDDDKMREIFKLIVSSFENLSCQSGRSYSKSVLILQSVAKLRSCVMMLDLKCDELITKMFELFQRSTSPNQPHFVVIAMKKIMSVLIQESDSVSRELLEVLLSSITKENQSTAPASCELGAKIIEECADKLKPNIMETVSSMGCCLEDFAPILSSICKIGHVILNSVTDDSSDHQLVHGELSAPAESVQPLMAVEHPYDAQGSIAGKAFGTERGAIGSRRKKKPNLHNVDDAIDKDGMIMKNDISGRSGKKLDQEEVSWVPGSCETKRLKNDHILGSGNKNELGQSRRDKIQSNNVSKNQCKRASSDEDVLETPHGRKPYKDDLVGSRIKVWWPLDHRYYEGTITSFDDSTRKHKVDYDDGDEEVLNLRKELWEFLGDESPDLDFLRWHANC